jgi:acyl-CoA synthetase (AMP-forming)/AMP-acid ligase II
VTYAGFAGAVETAAAGAARPRAAAGDAVAVASGNTLDLAVLLLACARARLVMVGLNTRLAPAQWAYMTEHMQVRLSLASAPFLADLPGALPLVRCCGRSRPARGPTARTTDRTRRRRTPWSSRPGRPGDPRRRRWCTARRCTPA